MRRKGQTAMEYLMTYGWAILIIIVVVAALYSLGVFSVKPSVACSPCFSYFAFVDYEQSTGTLRIRNGARTIRFSEIGDGSLGEDVVVSPATGTEAIADLDGDGTEDCDTGDECEPGRDIQFTGLNHTAGTDVRITITYIDTTSGMTHTEKVIKYKLKM